MQPLPLNITSAAYLTLEGTAKNTRSHECLDHHAPRMRNPGLKSVMRTWLRTWNPSRAEPGVSGPAWDERVLHFDEHAPAKARPSPLRRCDQTCVQRSRCRWRNYQKYFETLLEKLNPFAKAFGYD